MSKCSIILGAMIYSLTLIGCVSPKSTRELGGGHSRLSVGATYVTRVDAVLLARRGMIDEVANPRYTLERFQPNRDYNPYDTMPLGTITKGTLIRVERLGVFKDGTISVIGQIQSGPFVAEDRSAYSMARMITGPPRRTGRIVFNELVGGKHWSESAFAEHLEILP